MGEADKSGVVIWRTGWEFSGTDVRMVVVVRALRSLPRGTDSVSAA